MNRRAVTLVLAALPFAPLRRARAQQAERVRRIGFLLSSAGDALAPVQIRAFIETLGKLGWVEGRNLAILHRSSEGSRESLRQNAREIVELNPDVIVTVGGIALGDLLAETRSIPIVFAIVADPLGSGFVANLARPGGNATGFSNVQDAAIGGKWLELLREIAPWVTRALVIMQADSAPQRTMRDAVAAAASSLGLTLVSAEAVHIADYEREMTAFAREPNGGVVVLSNGIAIRHPEEIHALAIRFRLPAVYSYPIYARTGGLISYGADPVAQFPEAARYVDRILRGANPGDLPVQQPTRLELVINLRTANALGLTVPQSLLARADEVIE